MEKTLTTTTFMLFGIIWISIYWLQTVILFTALAIILSTVDIITGFLKARRKGEVSSIKMADWVLKKCLLMFVVFLIQVILWHTAYIMQKEWIAVLGLLLIVWYAAVEFVSILENINEMTLNKYEKKMFGWLFELSKKLLNRVEKKIEDKITEKK